MIDWDKGKAVQFLLGSLRLDDPESVLPIYIGDDRTDEDAFKVLTFLQKTYKHISPTNSLNMYIVSFVPRYDDQVLRERNCGYGILVSQVPKETQAFYSLTSPPEVKKRFSFSCLISAFLLILFSKLIGSFHMPNCHAGDGIPLFLGEMEGRITMNACMIKNHSSAIPHWQK